MRELSTAQEQLVQIAAAVGAEPRILVFDEPTSSLSATDAEALFLLIEDLKKRGLKLIYVSHRMPELFRLCDRMSILRHGRYVGTLVRAEMTHDAVVRMMIGRAVTDYFPKHLESPLGAEVLAVRRLSSPGKFHDVSFAVHAGEILGFAGLVGSGRSEIAQAIFGLDARATGGVDLRGARLRLGSIQTSLAAGVGLVPEDRKRQGCVLGMSCRANISMAILDRIRHLALLIDRSQEESVATEYFGRLQVKAASLDAPVSSLSGGNQQKIVIAKWLARGGRLLIVDEPMGVMGDWKSPWIAARSVPMNTPKGQRYIPASEKKGDFLEDLHGLGYQAEIAASADTLKWVQVDLGQSMPIQRVRLQTLHHDRIKGFGFP